MWVSSIGVLAVTWHVYSPLSLKTIGEYCAALHPDFLHSVDKNSYPSPQVYNMIRSRLVGPLKILVLGNKKIPDVLTIRPKV